MTEVERPSVSQEQFDELTRLQCLPRRAEMEDHARSVLFLCSEEAGFITGQNLQSCGGRTFL
jgi:NAD(P)-dependent dehydrogenase (short-subunit alcohol dehydrogenase family)